MVTSELTQAIEKLDRGISDAVAVVAQDDLDLQAEAQVLQDLKIRLRKLAEASDRPPCLGFFGPSQAGKSFLVGAILSRELGTLLVRCRERQVDFLREVNPAKGVESTGVVTRFSTASPAVGLRWTDFLCQVLTLEQLVESMATGFLVECTSPSLDPEAIDRCLQEARLQSGQAAPALYVEAWDFVWHSLNKKYRDRHPYLNELRRHPVLQKSGWKAEITTAAGWRMVYSLLWGAPGYASDLDSLFRLLSQGLAKLGFPRWIEAPLEHVRAASEGASLIDAACLNTCGRERELVRVFSHGSEREVSIEPGVLAALIAEIRMQLSPRSGSLLDHADILDFPGGRALKGINGFGPQELNSGKLENAIEVFKRGKLTYLFEQFSLDREITALVLCSPGPTKPEAVQLQSQVENWLQIRHGSATPAAPEELAAPSLFMALTKFDMSLGSLRSDNAKDRWDSRVQEACVDFWARTGSSWITNWGAKAKPFTNMYWIRNPYADQMSCLSPGDSDYEAVKAGYFQSRAVQRYISEHDIKWREVEGKDEQGMQRSGVPLLLDRIGSVLVENRKQKELQLELEKIKRELITLLEPFTPSKDDDERQARAVENARALIEALETEMARRSSGAVFSELMETVVASEEEIEAELRGFYKRVAQMSIKSSDKVKRLLVHVLKWWIARGQAGLAASQLELPAASVDFLLWEVCTSTRLLPILGTSIYKCFLKNVVDFALVAKILQVRISDALSSLFAASPIELPAGPVSLTYAPGARSEDQQEEEIDWTDMSFEGEEEDELKVDAGELVFAGKRYWEHFRQNLAEFYLANQSQGRLAAGDPRLKQLVDVLARVEGVDLGGR
ncbi:MAG: hypothetical protein HYV63_14380 [Candidatus Schekmanbacteria bacterium]|nr:hypothetical protein [Candidatus Schekmanbacteria bacterium]